jgi:uncharacterized protein YraI
VEKKLSFFFSNKMEVSLMKKIISTIILLATVATVLVTMTVTTSANTTQREPINATRFVSVPVGNNLNFRSGASTNHSIIGSIPRGTALHIIYAQGNWAYTIHNGRYGWVSREFISTVNPAAVSAPSPNNNRAQWIRSLIGTPARDWGNAPGTQCVDLAKWYAEQITPRNNRWVPLGNGNTVAQGIAGFHGWNYSTNRNDIRAGDIVSFVGTANNSFDRVYGHVVIVYEVTGNTFKYIDQWAGSGTVRSGSAALGRSDIVGRARPPA